MTSIEIDFEVYKALTLRRSSEEVSYNDVLRGLLGLGQIRKSAGNGSSPAAGDWLSKGVRFPNGTEFRTTALYLVAALALYLMQGQLIYPGQRVKIRERPLPAIAGLEAFRIPTPTGKAEAWYLPPLGSAGSFPAGVLAPRKSGGSAMWGRAPGRAPGGGGVGVVVVDSA